MSWVTKIDNKKYLAGTFINLSFAVYAGLPSLAKAWWLSFVSLSAVLNHYFTVRALSQLIENRIETGHKHGKATLFMSLLLKTIFLASGFICLLVFCPDKVLQGLLIYIFQLIILALSIKNIGNFYKKGPLP